MLLHEFLRHTNANQDLTKLFAESLTGAIVRIRQAIENTETAEKLNSENASGEQQLKLDVQANDILVEVLKHSGLVKTIAGEEIDGLETLNENGKYTLVFDPLDGSSLADVNFTVGTIIGVYPAKNDLLGMKTGDMVSAAIVLYGPRTTMIFSVGNGAHECTLNNHGQFSVTRENLAVRPDNVKHFAPGNLRATAERKDYLQLVNYWIENGYTLRYSGGMVPDVNHIFLKGEGIFAYPGYKAAPEGKLRLLFECGPMAFLMEQAGGVATDGKMRLLEKKITSYHQRTPILIGSKSEVERAQKYLSS